MPYIVDAKVLSVYAPKELVDRIDRLSRGRSSRSSVLREAIEEYLARRENTDVAA